MISSRLRIRRATFFSLCFIPPSACLHLHRGIQRILPTSIRRNPHRIMCIPCCICVSTSEVVMVERLGKFDRMLPAGLGIVCCPFEQNAGAVSFRKFEQLTPPPLSPWLSYYSFADSCDYFPHHVLSPQVSSNSTSASRRRRKTTSSCRQS